jgi:hypothetical protein
MNYDTEQTARDTSAIRPFHFHSPDAELAELRRRISATRWPAEKRSQINRRAPNSRRCRNSRNVVSFGVENWL